MEEFKTKINANKLLVTIADSKFELFKANESIQFSFYSGDLHLKEVTSSILINSNNKIIPLFPYIEEKSEIRPIIVPFENQIGSGKNIVIKCMFKGDIDGDFIQIPCSMDFNFYSSFKFPLNTSKMYHFLSIQIKIDFIPQDLSDVRIYGFSPLYAKNMGHLKLFPDFNTFNPRNISFYSNGWQSWSINRLLKYDDKWPSCPVKIGRINMENQDQKLSGRYQSEWHSVITDMSSDSALVMGFITLKDQFSRILMDPIEEDGSVSWLCAYSQTDSIPILQLNSGLLKSEVLMLVLVNNPESYDVLAHICHFGGINEKIRPSPVVKSGWCSWYYYYTKVKELDIISNLEYFKKNKNLPIGLIQLDDGYQTWISDWGVDNNTFNEKFPHGLKWLVQKIHKAGFKAGLWVAPFFIADKSQLLSNHPDWILKNQDAKLINTAYNWGHKNYAMDLSQDEAIQHLNSLSQVIGHEWEFDFLKIDFIYASEALGAIYKNPNYSRAQILRRGVQAIRDGLGENKILLGCGAPLGPCVGLVDVMRIGTDTAAKWSPQEILFTKIGKLAMPSLKATLRSTIQRSYMHNTWFYNDPDCVVVRENRSKLTIDEILLQLTVFGLSGGQVLISDDENLVSKDRLKLLNKILPPGSSSPLDSTNSMPIPLNIFKESIPTIYSRTVETKFGERYLTSLINWTKKNVSRTITLKKMIRYDDVSKLEPEQKFIIFDFWNEKSVGIYSIDEIIEEIIIPPRGCRYFSIIPIPLHVNTRPIFLSSTIHILQGYLEIKNIKENQQNIQIFLDLPGVHSGDLYFYLPNSCNLQSETNSIKMIETNIGAIAKVHSFLSEEQIVELSFN
ncbi:hypothetical protein NEF87_004712 [Candidatus Lokiarchaeum ossiferum]|uniref:Alpha-galactosidase n=1 Tax=Candidatus Lokiarchaeum ossiferum TaxID=2951803 RepID=A0ABY6I1H0_9ARCH|nr:hypothetical protein NEF87_004712 [Candidatus Lokiarchaeum sp. B-35]